MIGASVMHTRLWGLMAVALSAALVTTPAYSGEYTPGVIDKSLSGTTISVLVPPWATYKQAMLDDFTTRTGITVKVETVDFDAIHDKIVIASASGQAVADVIELDWTWVSQFGAAGWLTPLDKLLTPQQVQDAAGANAFNYQGQQIGIPYNLDFRGTLVNMTKFKQAGISDPPTTWAELLEDAKTLKTAGVVEYPIGMPLSITENTSTPWYTLIRAAGGEVIDEKGQPAFATNGLGVSSLQFIRDAYEAGLIDPGAIGLTTEQVGQAFVGGSTAVLLSAYPGSVSAGKSNVSGSNIVGDDLRFVHVPGEKNNTGDTIALEEALAIPVASKNKEAAAMYISWALEPKQQLAAFRDPDMGLLPTNQAALKELANSDDNKVMMDSVLQILPTIEAVIPGGPPTWYTKFSAEAAATIQSVALGQVTAAQAVDDLAQKTKQFASQAK
jgi:multiple sugar transport system substrate-binding protein